MGLGPIDYGLRGGWEFFMDPSPSPSWLTIQYFSRPISPPAEFVTSPDDYDFNMGGSGDWFMPLHWVLPALFIWIFALFV